MFVSTSTSGSPTQTGSSEAESLDPALIKLALAVLVGVIAAILDLTIVNVAITTLQHSLHASVSTIQWVSTGYALAVALTIPASGWVFERLGTLEFDKPSADRDAPVTAAEMEASVRRVSGVDVRITAPWRTLGDW